MADDQKFSKEVEAKNPRTMEQIEKQDSNKLSNAYDLAKSGQQQNKAEPLNSQQVAKSAPGMNGPNPPANAKNAMAQDVHKNSMAKDDARAKEAREIAQSIKKQKEAEQDKGKDKGQER